MSSAATRRRTPRYSREQSSADTQRRGRTAAAEPGARGRALSPSARKKKATKGQRAAKAQKRNAAAKALVATKPTAPAELSGKQQSYLRALAHHLKPVIQLGHQGLTPEVIEETDRALTKHELLKLKLGRECPEDRHELPAKLETATGARVVQVIGQTLLLYRARPVQPSIVLPSAKKRARTKAGVAPALAKRRPLRQDDALEEF